MEQSHSVTSTLDFSSYITERTHNFTGREWILARIDSWLAIPDSPGYFIITGEPGIGKTAIAARLTQNREVTAAHFCIARQADTLDPLNFARSISRQLTRLDGFNQLILEESGTQVSGVSNVQVNYGQSIGVYINNLIVTSPTASMAFNRTVVVPLKRLYEVGIQQQVVILVDALDEGVRYQGSETIVDLLANARGLPSQVRFVLTSRPESEALRNFEDIPHLLLKAESDENLQDVRAYIRDQVEISTALQERLVGYSVQVGAFVDQVAAASQGNFLYLVWLLPAIADGSLWFDTLNALPKGLDGIYREFLRTRRVGKSVQDWRNDYRPILAVLAAAQVPLTKIQLMQFTELSEQKIEDVLLDIQQFLEPTSENKGTYQLYHQSLIDFFQNKERAQEFWIDPLLAHQRIITYYRGGMLSWEDVNWSQIDDYGMAYLSTHLYALRDSEEYRRQLHELICRPLMQTKLARYGSYQSFAGDVTLALQVASAEKRPNLERVVRGSLLYATLVSLAMSVPPKALYLLARIGQAAKARDFAVLIREKEQQSLAYRLIAEGLLEREEIEEAKEVLMLASAAAKAIEEEARGDEVTYTIWTTSTEMGVSARAQALREVVRTLTKASAFDQALAVAEEIEDGSIKVNALSNLAQGLVQAGKKERAREVADQAVAVAKTIQFHWNKLRALRDIALTLIQVGEFDQAVAIVQMEMDPQWYSDISLQLGTLVEIAQILAQVGEKERTREVANQVMAMTIRRSFGNWVGIGESDFSDWDKLRRREIARTFVQVGEFDRALEIAGGIKGEDRVAILAEIAWDLALAGEKRRATEVADQALALEKTIQGSLEEGPTPYILAAIAQVLSQTGEKERAVEIAKPALAFGQKLAGETQQINGLVKVMQRLLQMGEKDSTTEAMTQAETIAVSMKGRKERADALNLVAMVVIQAGDLERALATIEKIGDKEQKSSALAKAVQALIQAGDLERALATIEKIEDKEQKSSALVGVAQALIQAGEHERVVQIANQAVTVSEIVEGKQAKTNALNRVARALAQVGKFDQALETVEAIEGEVAQADALIGVMQALAQSGQKKRAVEVARQAQTVAQAITRKQDKAHALIELVNALVEAQEKEEAAKVINQAVAAAQAITGKQDRARTLSRVMQILVQVGKKKEAATVLKQAMAVAQALESNLARASVLTAVIQALTFLKEKKRVIKAMNQAVEAAQAINKSRDRAIALYGIVQALAQGGEHDLALEVAKAIKRDSRQQVAALSEVAQACIQGGDVGRAKDVANQALTEAQIIKEKRQQVAALSEVAQVFIQGGDVGRARDVMNQALTEAQTIENARDKATMLSNVAQTLTRAGEMASAAGTVKQAWRAAEEIEGGLVRVDALVEVALAMFAAAQHEQTWQVLRSAFTTARLIGRESIFDVLERGAAVLAQIDQGQSLWLVYGAIHEIDGWWG